MLKGKLSLLLILLIPAVAITTIAGLLILKKIDKIKVEQDAENIQHCEKIAGALDKQLYAIERIVLRNVRVLEQITDLNESEIHKLLTYAVESSNEKNPLLYAMAIAFQPNVFRVNEPYAMFYAHYDTKTGLLLNRSIDTEYDYFGCPWYCVPQYLNKTIWSEPYYDLGAGNIMMTTCSIPFYRNINGVKAFAGIATADLTLVQLQKILDSFQDHEFNNLFMVSRFGLILSNRDFSKVMASSIFSYAYDNDTLDTILEVRANSHAGKQGKFIPVKPLYGVDKAWVYYFPLKSNQWTLMMFYNPENHSGLINSYITVVSIIGGVIYLFLTLVIFSIRYYWQKETRHIDHRTFD